jgi:hypothetical protein
MPLLTLAEYPLTRGLHQGIAPHRQPPGFSPRIQSIRIKDGMLSKRPGTRTFLDQWETAAGSGTFNADAAGTIVSLFEYRQEDGTVDAIAITGGAALANRKIYKATSTNWLNITDATLFDAAGSDDIEGSATEPYDAAVAPNASLNDVLYMSNGNLGVGKAELIKYTGSGNAVAFQGGPGSARTLATFANRLVLGYLWDGVTQFGNRVQWSSNGDAETWSGAGSAFVNLVETPDNITRLLTLRGRLIIYKSRSIYIGEETGLVAAPIGFILYSRDMGCPAGFTVASAGDRHFFLGLDNVYEFDGSSMRPIGDPIRPALRNINPSAYRQLYGFVDLNNTEYWLFVAEGAETYPKHAWVYNYSEQHWTRWAFPFNATAISRGVAGAAPTYADFNNASSVWFNKTYADMANITYAELNVSGGSNILLANVDETTEEVTSATANDGTAAVDAFWESRDFDFAGAPRPNGRPADTAHQKTLSEVSVRLRGTGSASTLQCQISTDGGGSFLDTNPNPATVPAGGGVVRYFVRETGSRFRVRLRNAAVSEAFPGVEEVVLRFMTR